MFIFTPFLPYIYIGIIPLSLIIAFLINYVLKAKGRRKEFRFFLQKFFYIWLFSSITISIITKITEIYINGWKVL